MPPKKRALWSQQHLEEAMRAITNGQLSVRAASRAYNIPRRTLRNHIKVGSAEKKIGRGTYLTKDEEQDLCARIKRLAKIGMPLTGKVLRKSVFTYCEKRGIDHPFKKEKKMAGRKWLKLFLNRHPDISKRKAQPLNAARAAKLNKFIVNDHFEKLRNLYEELDLHNNPQLVYNLDEKGCQLKLHKSPEVLAEKGVRNVHMISEEHAENVTIVACGNALGNVVPPMILMKGIRVKEEWKENLPDGSTLKMTAKGSMTTEIFVEYIKHFAKFRVPGKVLLIFDGASSHLDYTIVEEAEKHDIVLYCLPSNTTHWLQPMDKSVFSPFEEYWDQEVLNFWVNKPNRRIDKAIFGKILSVVWPKAASQSNVMSGFRGTGIYPFNPNVIPEEAFAPSEISRREPNEQPIPLPPRNNVTEQPRELINEAGPSGTSSHQHKRRNRSSSSDDSSSSSENISLHDTSSDDDSTEEDNNREMNQSFKELLPTPEVETKKIVPRKKSINYRAQRVTKNLFAEKEKKKNGIEKSIKIPKEKNAKKVDEKWYCHLCNEDRVLDMRLCNMCMRYVHEECVGLTKQDKLDSFICPSCSD